MLPPHAIRRDFLPAPLAAQFLTFVGAHEARFAPSALYGRVIDPTRRNSRTTRALGPLADELRRHFAAALPGLVDALRVNAFVPAHFEIEQAAHGDGAFFKPHIDTVTGPEEPVETDRVLSCVWYFHVEPKRYSGGALRLHRIGTHRIGTGPAGSAQGVDIEPEANMLVAFPSWAPHEVLPVSCPSERFMDQRFAVNCWVHRAKDGSRADRSP